MHCARRLHTWLEGKQWFQQVLTLRSSTVDEIVRTPQTKLIMVHHM